MLRSFFYETVVKNGKAVDREPPLMEILTFYRWERIYNTSKVLDYFGKVERSEPS